MGSTAIANKSKLPASCSDAIERRMEVALDCLDTMAVCDLFDHPDYQRFEAMTICLKELRSRRLCFLAECAHCGPLVAAARVRRRSSSHRLSRQTKAAGGTR